MGSIYNIYVHYYFSSVHFMISSIEKCCRRCKKYVKKISVSQNTVFFNTLSAGVSTDRQTDRYNKGALGLLIFIFYLFYLLIEIINLDLSLSICYYQEAQSTFIMSVCLSVCLFVDTLADSILKKAVFWETEIFFTYFLRLLQHFSIEEIIKCSEEK